MYNVAMAGLGQHKYVLSEFRGLQIKVLTELEPSVG